MEKKYADKLYYYCSDFKKFRTIEGDKDVDRKLCFICGVTGLENTARLHFDDGISTQICEQCLKRKGITIMREDITITKEDVRKYLKKEYFKENMRKYLRKNYFEKK